MLTFMEPFVNVNEVHMMKDFAHIVLAVTGLVGRNPWCAMDAGINRFRCADGSSFRKSA
jgi:hypothetical protein